VNDAVAQLFAGVRLTPTQRRIAHCLVDSGTRAAYLSSGEVAALAQVSQPSVTRFATALGFDGYPALRRHLRDQLATAGPPAPAGQNEFQRAVSAEADNLVRLAERLADRGPVAEAGKLLAASRPLPVLGLRSAAPLAGYFCYFAAKIHPDVRILDHGGSLLSDQLEQARAGGAGAMLAFVLPRYPREALDALGHARALGLAVVAVTDSPVSPAAAHADLTLPAPVGAQLVFDLHSAPMALAMVLLQAVCDAMPGQAQARLEEFEVSAARRKVFHG
jgi:DNA-binding MurR/RpiR family transcriptional regulator